MTEATVSSEYESGPSSSVLDVVAAKPQLAFASLMPRVTAEFGKTLPSQVKDLIRYVLRTHKLTIDEYYQMALYDDAHYPAEEKQRFIGLQKSRQIWAELMASNAHVGLINDKLMFEKTLTAFGFPMPETLAVMGGHFAGSTMHRIESVDALHRFLETAPMPLFAKPIDSLQSLGSVRIEGYSPSNRMIALSTGGAVSLEEFVGEVQSQFAGNYLFQRCVIPHPVFSDMTNGGVSTVRLVTLDSGDGAKPWRAAIKLTSPSTVADNFWRSGNLLSAIDLETGRMGKALTQMGIDGAFVAHHPDTDAQIEGVEIPYWNQAAALACNVAAMFPKTLILGFDIAITAEGPVIIEANADPHLIMMQIAHRQGGLDATMEATLAYAKKLQTDEHARLKASLRAETQSAKTDMKQALAVKSG